MSGHAGNENVTSRKQSKGTEVLSFVLICAFLGGLIGALVSLFGPAFGPAVLWGAGPGALLGILVGLSPEQTNTSARESKKERDAREALDKQDSAIRQLAATDPFVSQLEQFVSDVEASFGNWLTNEAPPDVSRELLNDTLADHDTKVRLFLRYDSASRLLGLLMADGSVEPHVDTYVHLSQIYLDTNVTDGPTLLQHASEPPSWLLAMVNTSSHQSDWADEIARISDAYTRYMRKVATDVGSAPASNASASAIGALNEALENAGLVEGPRRSVSKPEARLIRTPEDAEAVAAEFMQYLGYADARARPKGPDSGIDVESRNAVAQVKAQAGAVGRPAVQNLYGVARSLNKEGFFFSLGGYTREALDWGTEHSISMFSFDLQGEPSPANISAREKDP